MTEDKEIDKKNVSFYHNSMKKKNKKIELAVANCLPTKMTLWYK